MNGFILWLPVGFIIASVVWVYILFIFYLAYVTIRRQLSSDGTLGKFDKAPLLVRGVAWSILILGIILDILFNWVVGSILFLELPTTLTFTARCSKWMKSPTWRGKIARWFCDSWMNPFEDNHCGEK